VPSVERIVVKNRGISTSLKVVNLAETTIQTHFSVFGASKQGLKLG